MTIITELPEDIEFDCCVVGAGPVGLAFAKESAKVGRRVLLIDAGSTASGRRAVSKDGSARELITDSDRHAPVSQVVREGVGGTSWLWGGRCVTFEPIDFEGRSFVPDSQWPIDIDDILPWRPAAAEYLDCGVAEFRSDKPDPPGLGDFSTTQLERWARKPKLAPHLGAAVLTDPKVSALLEARLVDISFRQDGSVEFVTVERSGGRRTNIQARDFILAMGGLETTRLLLSLQKARPTLFGGPDGALGRFYMGHATGSVADVIFDDASSAAALDFERDREGTYIRRRFTLSEEAQRRHGVLNTSFYIDNPPFYEASHRNATLSLVFLGLVIPPIGRRILAEGIRLRHIGRPPFEIGRHIWNIVRRPFRAVVDVLDILRKRYVSDVRKPGFILANEGNRYALHYHAEQVPNPDSRVWMALAADDDALRIDFRYVEQDIDSLLRCHELLDAQLREARIGRIHYLAPTMSEVRESLWEQATDGFHSIGMTRMSEVAGDGVVDSNCAVHGSPNLHIASSSVFRTAGEANPTYLAACLAVRLAHHLADRDPGEWAAADESDGTAHEVGIHS